MSGADICFFCKKKFGVLRWRHKCTECGQTVCADCSAVNSFLGRRICTYCSESIAEGIASLKVVKSESIAGYSISESFETISSMGWMNDKEEALKNIKYQAYKLGANALVSLEIKEKRKKRHGRGDEADFIYLYLATARPVKMRKTNDQAPAETSIAGELEKLAALKEKGVITEEEFKIAKQKILG